MATIRRLGSDEWEAWREVRHQALGEAPHAFGSTLGEWQGTGDREDRWRARLDEVPFNVVALVDDQLVGQASGTEPDEAGAVEVISMWVAPHVRGTGIAEELLDAIGGFAAEQGATEVALSVRSANARAIPLYERAGFTDQGVSPDDPDERLMTCALPDRET